MDNDGPVTLAVPGEVRMFVHASRDTHVSRTIRESRIWEPYETSLVLGALGAGSVFVDVGANIGYFTLLAASLVGDSGKVFAFEPDPDNYQLMQTNCRLNRVEHRVCAARAGLSSSSGSGKLYLNPTNLGDHQIYPGDESRVQLDIQLLDGGRYLARELGRLDLDRIDLIKIDTQGSEYEVVLGLMPLLQSLPRVPDILVELTPLSLRRAGASGRALIELLAQLGENFHIVDHISHELVASSAAELAQWCDDVDQVAGDEGFMNIYVGHRREHRCSR